MLAQNFKKPAELGLSEQQMDALVKVLGMLERGEIPFRSAERHDHASPSFRFVPSYFNMRLFRGVGACGTISCIAGWAEYVGGLRKNSLVMRRFRNAGLCDLFDPTGQYSFDLIGTSQAAHALRNYLTTGEPRWNEVMAADSLVPQVSATQANESSKPPTSMPTHTSKAKGTRR